jgi:hypothetical protein
VTTRALADLLAELRSGPPTLDVRPAAQILDVAASSLYEAIRRGDAPVRTFCVGKRIKVLTTSVIEILDTRAIPVRSGEMLAHLPSSEGVPDGGTTCPIKRAGAPDAPRPGETTAR